MVFSDINFVNDPNVENSVAYLRSSAARESLHRNFYWPKWNSPWWHMTLLWELGAVSLIPGEIVDVMIEVLDDERYLKVFPIHPEDLPDGVDASRDTNCHCALGTMYQVLHARGVDVDARLPWVRPWFLRYQLPDGGLNCDNDAYLKPTPKSSIVSTLPPLEALLRCTSRSWTPEEERFLDRGASYLIEHQLFRAARTGKTINEDWLKLCFPRFYEYDVLRGLSFLAEWAERRQGTVPVSAISPAVEAIRSHRSDSGLRIHRDIWKIRTLVSSADGTWEKREATTFPLLLATSAVGGLSDPLTAEWRAVERRLNSLEVLGAVGKEM